MKWGLTGYRKLTMVSAHAWNWVKLCTIIALGITFIDAFAFCKCMTFCTTIHRYAILSTRYSVMCKVYTVYCGTSEIEHGFCACTVDNPLAKARGLSLRTGAQTMLYLSLVRCQKTKGTLI